MIECQTQIDFEKRIKGFSKEEIENDEFYGCRLCLCSYLSIGCERFVEKKRRTKL